MLGKAKRPKTHGINGSLKKKLNFRVKIPSVHEKIIIARTINLKEFSFS